MPFETKENSHARLTVCCFVRPPCTTAVQRIDRPSAFDTPDCIENAGRLPAADYRRATLYSTLSPCDMCSGTVLLYRIPRVVIGENRTFQGPEDYLRSRGVELVIADSQECRRLMDGFMLSSSALWNEDIGEA